MTKSEMKKNATTAAAIDAIIESNTTDTLNAKTARFVAAVNHANALLKLPAEEVGLAEMQKAEDAVAATLKAVNEERWEFRFEQITNAENPMLELVKFPMINVWSARKSQKRDALYPQYVAKEYAEFVSLPAYELYCNLHMKDAYANNKWKSVLSGVKGAMLRYMRKYDLTIRFRAEDFCRVEFMNLETQLGIQQIEDMSALKLRDMLQYIVDSWLGAGYKVKEADADLLTALYIERVKSRNNEGGLKKVKPVSEKQFVEDLVKLANKAVTGVKFELVLGR